MNTNIPIKENPIDHDSFFPFGSMYVPVARATEIPMSEWEQDIIQMKEMGFTIIRSWAAWDRIELEEGKYDFKKIDYIFDLCDKHDMKIILFIGGAFRSLVGCYPPVWLRNKHQIQKENSGKVNSLSDICFDDPSYKEKAEHFLEILIKRYSSRRSLHSWIVWGEPAWKGCHCQYTLDNYRIWLKNKYSDLSTLNRAWSTEVPIAYSSWKDVESLSTGFVPSMDWQEFCEVNLNNALSWIYKLVKTHSDKPAMAYPCPWEMDARAIGNMNNFWLTGKTVDMLGMSHYVFQYPHKGKKGYVPACYLDRIRSAARNDNFWITENQAGPFLWNFKEPNDISLKRNALLHAQMLAHGAKGILSWMYRTRITDRQAGEFGLMAWDGSLTERAESASEFAQFVKRNATLFSSLSYSADIAILSAQSTLRLTAVEGCENEEGDNYWQNSWLGAYKLIWDLKLQADFIDDDEIIENKLQNYKILLIPFRLNISEEIAAKIENFVAAGGWAIADFPFGMKNDQGALNTVSPGCNLKKVFGYSSVDNGLVHQEEITIDNKSFPAHLFKQQITPTPDGEVIGRYHSEKPAVIMNHYQKGRTVMFASMFFAQYEEKDNKTTRELMRSWSTESGIIDKIKIHRKDLPDSDISNIEVCALQPKNDKSQTVYFILNHNNEKIDLTCFLNKELSRKTEDIIELFNDIKIDFRDEKNGKQFDLILDAMEFAVILLS